MVSCYLFSWVNIFNEDETVKTSKMVKYITSYGVDAYDKYGYNISRFFDSMDKQQLKLVIRDCHWNPKIGCNHTYYPSYHDIHDIPLLLYVVKLLLKYNYDVYMKQCIVMYGSRYDNLEEYVNYRIYNCLKHGNKFFDNGDDVLGVFRAQAALINDRRKRFTLFELMLPCLEDSDKKRRFH